MIDKVTWLIKSTCCEEWIAPLFEWALAWKPSCYDRIPIFTRLISSIKYCFTGPLVVRVHRTHLRDELTELFSDPEILQETIVWRLIDDHGREEEGVRAGVQRHIFSTFWQTVFCSYTLGDVENVPCIRHDLQKSQWEAIGRVLTYGFKYWSYILFPHGQLTCWRWNTRFILLIGSIMQ